MLGFQTPVTDREFARLRHGGRTPALGIRIFDQNSGLPQTGGPKKAAAVVPYTPARQDIGKDVLGTSKALRTGSRALQDKTPFPNRQQQQIFQPVFSKLNQPVLSIEVDNLDKSLSQRPSSTRTSLKVPRSASRSFEAASPRGINQSWDISDGNISLVDSVPEEPSEDTDEPEYMPPTAVESSWEPDYDLPDFKQLGTSLAGFSRAALRPYDPEDFVNDRALAEACGWGVWDKINVPDIDSDDDSPFEKPPPPTKPPSKTAGKANPVSRLANTARPVVKSSVHTSAKRPTAAQRPPLRTKAAQVVSHTDFGLGETNIVDEF